MLATVVNLWNMNGWSVSDQLIPEILVTFVHSPKNEFDSI